MSLHLSSNSHRLGTGWPDIFREIARPFEPFLVESRPRGGRPFEFVTTGAVMNRLDEVLGPESWWDEFSATEEAVVCRLTIRLPDGRTITKAGAGRADGSRDTDGDDQESGYSEAFKRAAAKFGVARYLYRDGAPSPSPRTVTSPTSAPSAPPDPDLEVEIGEPPTGGKGLFAAIKDLEARHTVTLIRPLNDWGKEQNFPKRLIDWDPGQISGAWAFIAASLAEHARSNPPDLPSIRKSLFEKCRTITAHALGVNEPEHKEVGKTLNRILEEVSPGESVERLGKLTDLGLIRRLIIAADEELSAIEGLSF